MWKLRNIIWSFFGTYYQRNDSYKDAQGRGLVQRYQEVLAGEMDVNFYAKLAVMTDRLHVPAEMVPQLIPYREQERGIPAALIEGVPVRRKVLRYLLRLHANRGTVWNYKFLFALMGFDCQIVEYQSTGRFDTGVFDDGRFDQYASNSGDYDILLSSTPAMKIRTAMYQAILRIIDYNNPIFARVGRILYNGSPIVIDDSGNGYVNDGYVQPGYVN